MSLPASGPTNCSSGLSARVYNNLAYDNPWKANQGGYAIGVHGCPLTLNGFGYSVSSITSGVTGSTEPAWPTTVGNTVVDGGVTWHCDVACNPSGNGQNFQGVFNAAAIAALQLLAYDTARAICDELAADAMSSSATQQVAQAVANSTLVVINFDTINWDTANAIATGAAWKWTCPAGGGGKFNVSTAIDVEAPTAGSQYLLSIYVNGSEVRRICRPTTTGTNSVNFGGSADVSLNAGDYVQIVLAQFTGVSLNVGSSGGGSSYFTIHRLHGT